MLPSRGFAIISRNEDHSRKSPEPNVPPVRTDQEQQQNRARFRNGFATPEGADDDQVESLLNEYAQGRVRIADLWAVDLSKSAFLGLWLDEDDAQKRTNEVMRAWLEAIVSNHTLSEQLISRLAKREQIDSPAVGDVWSHIVETARIGESDAAQFSVFAIRCLAGYRAAVSDG